MGFLIRKLIAVMAFCILINTVLCLGRRKPGFDVLYGCFWRQLCTCKISGRFKDCSDHMTKQSQRWIFEQVNACDAYNLDCDNIMEGLQNVCSVDEKEFKPCYDDILSYYKKRYSEVVMGIHGRDESDGFENARTCLETIVNFCESNPDGCMSVG